MSVPPDVVLMFKVTSEELPLDGCSINPSRRTNSSVPVAVGVTVTIAVDAVELYALVTVRIAPVHVPVIVDDPYSVPLVGAFVAVMMSNALAVAAVA